MQISTGSVNPATVLLYNCTFSWNGFNMRNRITPWCISTTLWDSKIPYFSTNLWDPCTKFTSVSHHRVCITPGTNISVAGGMRTSSLIVILQHCAVVFSCHSFTRWLLAIKCCIEETHPLYTRALTRNLYPIWHQPEVLLPSHGQPSRAWW